MLDLPLPNDMPRPPIADFIWDNKYRLKDLDGTVRDQTIQATWARVAKALASPEEDPARWELAFYEAMNKGYFLPAGRIIAGAGSERNVTLSNCFVMGTIGDSMASIFDHLKEAALTMQAGGGIGYDFSTLRPQGAPVKGVGADASGPLTFMDVWDAMCRTVMSAGSRRGAMMATMRCDHPDIEAFVEAKQDGKRLRMFNLSVLVTDDFMAAVRADADWQLVHEVMPAQKDGLMRLLPEGARYVYRTIRARDLWDKITRSTYNAAEPGVIFIDRVNRLHNLSYMEVVAATNPCGEKPMAPYDSCLLGSINLVRLVRYPFTHRAYIDRKALHHVVKMAVRAMDNVIALGQFPLDKQREKSEQTRQLGLGITGLADTLMMMGRTYGTPDAAAFSEELMATICDVAYNASVDLAIEKGPFPAFEVHGFLEGETFAARRIRPSTQERIRKHGIRNSLLISIAPTGTISLFAGNVSSGCEPVFAASYERKVLNPDGSHTVEIVEDYALALWKHLGFSTADMPYPPAWITAQELTPADHIRMVGALQKHVDSAISKTINVPEEISFEDFQAVYDLAWEHGMKGCTTYRPNEVTGSVLTAVPEKAETEESPQKQANGFADHPVDVLKDAMNLSPEIEAQLRGITDQEVDLDPTDAFYAGVLSVNLTGTITPEQAARLGSYAPQLPPDHQPPRVTRASPTFAAPYGEKPEPRPVELEGSTYKIKVPGDEHAIYVTINDVEENGVVRPYEVFINTANPAQWAMTTALTRLISALFRRPFDSSFVAQELQQVVDPSGGGWVNGTYIKSVPAAVGYLIDKHMKKLAGRHVADQFKEVRLAESMTKARAFQAEVDQAVVDTFGLTPDQLGGALKDMGPGVMSLYNAPGATIRGPGQIGSNIRATPTPSRPLMCDKCGGTNVTISGGCPSCGDCGHSKCG